MLSSPAASITFLWLPPFSYISRQVLSWCWEPPPSSHGWNSQLSQSSWNVLWCVCCSWVAFHNLETKKLSLLFLMLVELCINRYSDSCESWRSISTVIRQIKQSVLSAVKVVQHDALVTLMASGSICSLRELNMWQFPRNHCVLHFEAFLGRNCRLKITLVHYSPITCSHYFMRISEMVITYLYSCVPIQHYWYLLWLLCWRKYIIKKWP